MFIGFGCSWCVQASVYGVKVEIADEKKKKKKTMKNKNRFRGIIKLVNGVTGYRCMQQEICY